MNQTLTANLMMLAQDMIPDTSMNTLQTRVAMYKSHSNHQDTGQEGLPRELDHGGIFIKKALRYFQTRNLGISLNDATDQFEIQSEIIQARLWAILCRHLQRSGKGKLNRMFKTNAELDRANVILEQMLGNSGQ